MSLTEKLKEPTKRAHFSLFGNRIAALGAALLIGGLGQQYAERNITKCIEKLSLDERNSYRETLDEIKKESNSANVKSGALANSGAFIFGITSFGLTTSRIYNQTRRKIKNSGEIGERFFETAMGRLSPGYCQYCRLQGFYLAAKEEGKLDEFKKLKEKYGKGCIIPNF